MLLAGPPLHPPSIHILWITPFVGTVFLRSKNSQKRCNCVCKDFCTESNHWRSAFRSEMRDNVRGLASQCSETVLPSSNMLRLNCHQTGIYKGRCCQTSTNKSRYDFISFTCSLLIAMSLNRLQLSLPFTPLFNCTAAVMTVYKTVLLVPHLIYYQYAERTYWNQSNLLSQRDQTLRFIK